MEAALCLAANGIKAYRFESLRPTPELSFAVRYLDCVAGINVTASHNPPEYNGYKVYWEDGAQITPPHDTGIMAEVKAITDFADTKTMEMIDAIKAGLLVTIGAEVDDAYMGELKKLVLHQDAIDKYGKDLKIVYTPLHGTGNIPLLPDLGNQLLGSYHPEVPVPEQHIHFQIQDQKEFFLQEYFRMQTDLVYMQRIPRQANIRYLPVTCQEAFCVNMK